METYLIYIGKSAIAAGAFYLAFLILFQNQKHFRFNRIYLPVSLAISFVIPLITFTTVKYIEPANFDVNSFAYLAPDSVQIVQPAFVFEWYHYLFVFYILGVAGFLFHLLLGHLKAISIIQKSRTQKLFDALINITIKDVHPFSFFSKIVISENTLDHPNLKMIVEHENIHVKEKHTLDILFAEILFLFQWFNPFAWLIKDAMKNNLEYLTDYQIVQNNNAKDYQLAMVALADKQGVAPFLNALNGGQLKNRIVMMKKKKENKYAFVKQLLVLPLLAVLVMGLSNKEVKTEFVETETQPEIYNSSSKKYTIADIEISGIRYLDQSVLLQLSGLKIGQEIEVPGNAITTATKKLWKQGLFSDVKISASKIVDDNVWLDIYLRERPRLSDINFYGVSKSEEDDIKDKLSLLKGSQFTEKQVNDARQTIENIFVAKGFSGTEVDIVHREDLTLKNSVILDIYVAKKDSIVIRGQNSKGDSTKPEDIKVTGFGTQVRPTTTFESANNNGVGFDFGSFSEIDPTGPPLYIIDGIELKNIENIAPGNIESISVLKDKSATDIYGEKGRNGVVLIITKNKEKIEPVKVSGKEQVIGNINWINNEIYSSNELTNLLGIRKGNVYSKEYVENRIYGEVSSLYLDNGYLFFNITIAERKKENGIVDLDLTVFEGTQWKIGKIEITGNKTVSAKEYINKIDIKSGDLFSRSKLIQSARSLNEMINLDNEMIDVDVNPETENSNNIVNLVFIIKGKNGEILNTTKNEETIKPANVAGNALIMVDGKEYKSFEEANLSPDEIASMSVLKGEDAIHSYGGQAKDGVVLINTKTKYNSDIKINSGSINPAIWGLRYKISSTIKYPVAAQENNQQGVVEIWAFIEKDGTISNISEKRPDGKFINIDEVVVTSLKSETSVTSEKSNDLALLVKESKRVIEQLSPLKIPELAGETVSFRIRFVLE